MSDPTYQFVHLNVHTHYSLLESSIRVKDLVRRVDELGMTAVAITDTHNLFGAIDFYMAAIKQGVKPIIGCEIFYAHESVPETTEVWGKGPEELVCNRITVLCKDLAGYRNLCKLVTQSYYEAKKPKKASLTAIRAVATREMLDEFGGGLIVLTGGLRGELAKRVFEHDHESVDRFLTFFQNRFADDFYIELQDHGIPEEDQVNEVLYKEAKKRKIQVVATNQCHYLTSEYAGSHEVLQCIDLGRNLDIDRPDSLVPKKFYVKSTEEMIECFDRYDGAVENTVKIAEKCNVNFQFKDDEGKVIYHLPQFRPEGVKKTDQFDTNQYFREESLKGLEARFLEPSFDRKRSAPSWEKDKSEYYDRIKYELDMIVATGFAGYFLIVADFINWAKNNDIPVGPGRGSGAGSIVAYSLNITDIDPIQFNLLFERFINPERVSMPDFDIDFCQERRGEVIEYVSNRYGKDNVCQIITFGKLQARAALKDVGRVLGLSFAETDQVTKLLPDELGIRIKDAVEREPMLREKMDSDSRIRQVVETALELEGLYRNPGIHAAGVIITEAPVVDYAPLYVTTDSDVVTQFDKDYSEAIGLVKFDFLGLKTLTVIDNAVKLVRANADPGSSHSNFDLRRIPIDDPKVYDLIGSGDTNGVFQVESSGMKDLCSRMKPSTVDDLTAICALYRPGPLGSGMVDDYIDRKHGRKTFEYELDLLEPILKETYGVILYQEQVMQIARDLAGYSLGQADMLRRAMGKKKPEEMARHREIFVEGATKRNIDSDLADSIFDLMAKFAEYGFNKSHSAAYGMLTYQTGYLKSHFPSEFLAALMTTEINNTDKITKYIADARTRGLVILPPDVNYSQKQFTVEKIERDSPRFPKSLLANEEVQYVKGIRFGLEAIKGVGGIAVDSIIEARKGGLAESDGVKVSSGLFLNVLDFVGRVPKSKVNKKVLESLVLSGGFDSIAEANRASMQASIDTLVQYAADEQEERILGQSSLFDNFDASEIKISSSSSQIFKNLPEFPDSKKLLMEKKTVGFYVSGHPMDSWQRICDDWLGWTLEKVFDFARVSKGSLAAQPKEPQFGPGGYVRKQRKKIQVAGLVSDWKELTSRKGDRMAFGAIEDLGNNIRFVLYPSAYAEFGEKLSRAFQEAEPLIFEAEISTDREPAELIVNKAGFVKEIHSGREANILIELNLSEVTVEQLRTLKKTVAQSRGKSKVTISFSGPEFRTTLLVPNELRVKSSPEFVSSVNELFGRSVVRLQ